MDLNRQACITMLTGGFLFLPIEFKKTAIIFQQFSKSPFTTVSFCSVACCAVGSRFETPSQGSSCCSQ